VKITIDQKSVEATPGETILQAAQRAGIRIPNLCHYGICQGKGLCRICIVEIKTGSETRLVESCTYPVMDQLVVRTSSPFIYDIRRSMINLLVGKGDLEPGDVAGIIGSSQDNLWLDLPESVLFYDHEKGRDQEPDVIREGLLSNPYLAFIIVDKDGYIRSINETCLDRMGIKLEDALGKYITDVVPNSELPEILKTGRTDRAEFWPINGHDTIVNRVPLVKDGKIIGAIAYSLFLDMSGARFFMDKLQEREKEFDDFLQGLLENPYLAYIIVDKNARITAINQATLDILELDKSDAMGKYVLDVLPNSLLHEIVKTGRTDRAEFWPIKDRDTIVNRLPILKDGKIIGALGYSLFLDIAGARLFAEKLQKREKEFNDFLQGLLENPYLAYYIIDQNSKITAINQASLDILEIDKQDAMGKNILEVIPNSELPQILATGRIDRAEFWTIKDHDMVVNRMPITKDGEIIGAIGYSIFLDKTGAKIFSQKLIEMEKQLSQYKEEIKEIYSAKWTLNDLIGISPSFSGVRSIVERLSFTTSTVLITGESGTGKELVAQAIHNSSLRKTGPFIRINCVALPENLLESELFGYEEGAFTGAKKGGKPGKFELAAGGTIFLDEIGDMPLTMQTKLLGVLQEKVVERVGGTKPIPVDVRVIAATNQDLATMVSENKFRGDLYYRLNVMRLDLPPLRNRMEDLPLLVNNLIIRINQKLGTNIQKISPQALELLQNYSWPGNVRELENLLEQAVNLAFMNQERSLGTLHFPSLMGSSIIEVTQVESNQLGLTDLVQNLEKELIVQALAKTGNNKFQTAKILGLNISALYRKLHKYGIEHNLNNDDN
jgi:transcriptional regulator with PAS, ATPase and Fis domain